MSNLHEVASYQGVQITHRFLLFTAGSGHNSILARQNIEALCEVEFGEQYELQVINVFEDHGLALEYRILVTPCLVMVEPKPAVMVAGTLQDLEQVRVALRLNQE